MGYIYDMYAGCGMNTGKITIYVLLYVAYLYVFFYLLCTDQFLENERNAKYIYTRTSDRRRWYLLGIGKQLAGLLLKFMIWNLIVFAVDLFLHVQIPDIVWLLEILVFQFLHLIFLIVFLNLMALFFKASFVRNCIFAMDIFTILAVGQYQAITQTKPKIFHLLPSINALQAFHANGDSAVFCILIFSMEIILTIAAGTFLINRIDIYES